MTESVKRSEQEATMISQENTDGSLFGIDDEYWLSEEEVHTKLVHRLRNRAAGNGFGFHLSNVGGVAFTVDCGCGKNRANGNFIGYLIDEYR